MVTKFLLSVLVLCLQQRHITCYRVISNEIKATNGLSCLSCYNGQPGIDCINIGNGSGIPTQVCLPEEPFCKVRRLTTDDVLTTLDRMCDSYCTPGCKEAAWYVECISCCNQESLCNKDNAASGLDHSFGKFKSHAHNPFFVLSYFLVLYVIFLNNRNLLSLNLVE
ncbi:unnamed protein product [Lymnaea stagnalis]|uniref:Uncharacterized protein n=1 Tax=Lymnaea stagnalis TaxID=6523 RepID=A0AAV2H8C5_LYMST